MKKYLTLVPALLLLLSVLCSCSVPHKQPDETTGQSVSNTSAPEMTAPPDGKPYFQLTALPEIGSYYDGTVYKRMTENYVDTFTPSDKYGALVPYLGDYRYYEGDEPFDDEDWLYGYDHARYGLMTEDGTVITDPVYDYIYVQSGFLVLRKEIPTEDEYVIYHCTILPESGKWTIEFKCYPNSDGRSFAFSDKLQRVFICNGTTLSGYDYSGKKLFTSEKSDYMNFEVLEESGFVLVTRYSNDSNTVELLDKNGEKRWEKPVKHAYPGEGSSRYFECRDDTETDSENDSGIMDLNGNWVIPPGYTGAYVYGDKFFVCDDGTETTIYDKDMNEISRAYGRAYDYRWFGGELLWCEYDSSTRNILYYSLGDDEPIMPKGKEVVDVSCIEGTALFFGVAEDGTGYLYTRDGRIKKNFADVYDCDNCFVNGMFVIYTGSKAKRTAHVIDAERMEEVYRYVSYDEANDNEIGVYYTQEPSRSYLCFYEDSIKEPERESIVRVVDIRTDKVVADGCTFAETFTVNSKTYYCAVKDNLVTVVNEDGKVLLHMPCSYVD